MLFFQVCILQNYVLSDSDITKFLFCISKMIRLFSNPCVRHIFLPAPEHVGVKQWKC